MEKSEWVKSIRQNIAELKTNLDDARWIEYNEDISWAPLDFEEKEKRTSLHLVRVAPRGEISRHYHIRPQDGIEILYLGRGKRLIYSGQEYEIENASDDYFYIISQFFPAYTGDSEIRRHG